MWQNITQTRRQQEYGLQRRKVSEFDRLKNYKFVDIKIGSRAESFVNPGMRESKYGLIRYDGPPMYNASAYKQDFLKGDKEAVFYFDPNNPAHTSYALNHKGMQQEDRATILDDGRTTFAGPTSPDPAMMRSTMNRWNELENDRMRISRRIFAKSGMTTLSPKGRNGSGTFDFQESSRFGNSSKKL